MKLAIRYQFQRELAARGFKGPKAPNGTITLDDEYLSSVAAEALMEELLLRREKVAHIGNVVGMAQAKKAYDDVTAAIEALKVLVPVEPPA